MSANRMTVLLSILRGFLIAALITIAGMLLIAVFTVYIRIADSAVSLLNQLLKIASVVLGTAAAVGRGGSRGFVTGMVVALLYMTIGYALYVVLGGGSWSVAGMLGEILIGVAVGGVTGAILANLSPRGKRKRRK